MNKLGSLILITLLVFESNNLVAQKKQTYKSNGTTYYSNETYSTTGKPKVERSSSAKYQFLKSKGYTKIPHGYQIDHIVPLSEGGADVPSNMQLITVEEHNKKTALERVRNNQNSTYKTPSYKSNSTNSNSNIYSKPSYSNNSGRTTYTGSKGGNYYINSKGNKTYVKRK